MDKPYYVFRNGSSEESWTILCKAASKEEAQTYIERLVARAEGRQNVEDFIILNSTEVQAKYGSNWKNEYVQQVRRRSKR
jgi:hypothetical protein